MQSRTSPFLKFVSLRTKIRFALSALVLVAHAFFVGGIAFYRDFFAQPLFQGGTITVGILAAVLVILVMILSEWLYIWISEKWLDPMQDQVAKEINK